MLNRTSILAFATIVSFPMIMAGCAAEDDNVTTQDEELVINKYHRIQSQNTGLCMEAVGDLVYAKNCNSSHSQLWIENAYFDRDDYYLYSNLSVRSTGKCLDGRDPGVQNKMAKCKAQSDRLFETGSFGDGSYAIRDHNDYCLERSGDKVISNHCNGSAPQRWLIYRP